MAEELRLALSLLGSLAVGAVVLHGIWTVRKTSLEERKQAEQQKQQEAPEIDEEEREVQALKIKQMEIDFSDISQPDSNEGLPVVDVNVDSIYEQSNTKGEMKSFLSHARQLEQNPDVNVESAVDNSSAEAPSSGVKSQQDAFANLDTPDTARVDEPVLTEENEVELVNTTITEDDDLQLEGFSAYGNVRDEDIEPEQIGAFSSTFDSPVTDPKDGVVNEAGAEQPRTQEAVSQEAVPQQAAPQRAAPEQAEPKHEVLILFVDKPSGEMIEGAKLLPLLLTLGFKFGEMDFFHRHEQSSGHGEILFSLANMYNPGTFDIDHMEQVSTRGLSIFMTLPNAGEALQTFNMMHNAAKKIADEFGARVLDAERQPLDVVRVRNYVDKIRKF